MTQFSKRCRWKKVLCHQEKCCRRENHMLFSCLNTCICISGSQNVIFRLGEAPLGCICPRLGAHSIDIYNLRDNFIFFLYTRGVNPMLAIQGCCNYLPGCGTALCSVQDKQTQLPIFYNLFQKTSGNLANVIYVGRQRSERVAIRVRVMIFFYIRCFANSDESNLKYKWMFSPPLSLWRTHFSIFSFKLDE